MVCSQIHLNGFPLGGRADMKDSGNAIADCLKAPRAGGTHAGYWQYEASNTIRTLNKTKSEKRTKMVSGFPCSVEATRKDLTQWIIRACIRSSRSPQEKDPEPLLLDMPIPLGPNP